MHLNPKTYHFIQWLAHGNYEKILKRLDEFLEIKKNDNIIELGCGDGILANHFINLDCNYYGIDIDFERIKKAQKENPKAKFFSSGILKFDLKTLPTNSKIFCHGVLHHLNDDECNKVIEKVLKLKNDMFFVTVEPIRSKHWYTNPIGTFLTQIDDGDYIRTFDQWMSLFKNLIERKEIMRQLPRWPVDALFLKLTKNSGD